MTNNLIAEIKQLREEKNAVILAHYYQDAAIQDIADFVGDSLELARKAAATDAEVIAFCGVHFMAETAKILNPSKTVVLPDLEAGCSLASGCPPEEFSKFRARYPDHFVVSYINCSAAVKAQSDLICTSSNAVRLVEQIPADIPILFAPDKNLGRWVERQTVRKMVLWDGSCQVHEAFSEEALMELWIQHPEYEVIAHPECTDAILRMADFIGSTSALLKRVQDSSAEGFIVLTEPGILHKMRQLAPDKVFLDVPALGQTCKCNLCPWMAKNTLEKLRDCLLSLSPRIEMEEKLRLRALYPLERMLEWS
jgi:quinolinate synthase